MLGRSMALKLESQDAIKIGFCRALANLQAVVPSSLEQDDHSHPTFLVEKVEQPKYLLVPTMTKRSLTAAGTDY